MNSCVCAPADPHTQITSNHDRPRFRFGRPHQGTHTHSHTNSLPLRFKSRRPHQLTAYPDDDEKRPLIILFMTVQIWVPAPLDPHTQNTKNDDGRRLVRTHKTLIPTVQITTLAPGYPHTQNKSHAHEENVR
jgi:hypothetical protein